ncbi:MAG: glutathione S-transferase family protein [Variibacter sp.]|nr:glutathione S-transferase family protein [Variibacter sp.]
MGLLVDGVWHDQWYDTKSTGGRFERQASRFRNWVTPDGAPGPSGEGGFAAEPGRYHLYVSHACPWAHRTAIFRKLKQLEDAISLSVVSYHMGPQGWTFDAATGSTGDPLYGKAKLSEIYVQAEPRYTGRVSVPVLWDRKRETIVNNESSEIIRMLNAAFDAVTPSKLDFYPAPLRAEIDAVNALVYPAINNGVYRTGFATTQEAYEEAFARLFDALDTIEQRLSRQRYLVGTQMTEADWRLFTTLVRFDAVYVGHFKCNRQRIVDYPNLWSYLRELYQVPGVAETVHMDHIKHHYYGSHRHINPTGIVPLGPELDFSAPHDRARFG